MRLPSHLLQVDAEALQDSGSHTLTLAQQPDEQVLGTDVGVVHSPGLIHCQLDDLLRSRGEANFALGGLVAPADDELYG